MKRNGDIRALDGGTVRVPKDELERFKKNLNGGVLMPGDPDYEEARRVWNGMIDRRPAPIARCAATEDVATAAGFARAIARCSSRFAEETTMSPAALFRIRA